MCGLLGGLFARPYSDADVAAVRSALRTLVHRGPDAEGLAVVREANAVLGFRRLSIIDLATGDQPMTTGAGHHILFNGEIYNYRDVRLRLAAAGVPFRTQSDTEVLLHSLARSGIAGLEPLRGMWGLAFLDVPGGRLILARDRLGVKQLYYADTPAGLFFASEPKALLALPWVTAELAVEHLPAYFTFRCVPAPATLFRGIRKLAAGTALVVDLATRAHRVERYWSVPEPSPPEGGVTLREAVDRMEAALLEAVRRRLVSDVPVGAFLSGGLDSSLVAAAISRLGHRDIRTFSATFPGSPDDEASFARRVAARFGLEHYEHPSDPSTFIDALPTWTELNDDLVADASSLPLLGVSRLARARGCIVMLSGEGADELFGGYRAYRNFVILRALAGTLPRPVRAVAHRALARVLPPQDQPRIYEYFVNRGQYMGTAALLGEHELRELLGSNAAAAQPRAPGSRMADLGWFDFKHRIPDDLLVRTDRATMGASIEARVPFLDQDLVAAAFALPGRAKAVPGLSKVALRLLARRWGVPTRTIVHRKIGFQLPLGRWFRRELRPFLHRAVEERLVPGIGYDYVRAIAEHHAAGRGQFEELLWRITALELWYRRWVLGFAADAGPDPGGVAAGSVSVAR